jgi:hypothetical protein
LKQKPKQEKLKKEQLYQTHGEAFMSTRILKFNKEGFEIKRPSHLGTLESSDEFFSRFISKDLVNPGLFF